MHCWLSSPPAATGKRLTKRRNTAGQARECVGGWNWNYMHQQGEKNWTLSGFTSSSLKRATNDRSLDFTTLHDDDEKKKLHFFNLQSLNQIAQFTLDGKNSESLFAFYSTMRNKIKYRAMMLTRLTVATWCSSPSAASQSWPMVCARKSATCSAAWKCVC